MAFFRAALSKTFARGACSASSEASFAATLLTVELTARVATEWAVSRDSGSAACTSCAFGLPTGGTTFTFKSFRSLLEGCAWDRSNSAGGACFASSSITAVGAAGAAPALPSLVAPEAFEGDTFLFGEAWPLCVDSFLGLRETHRSRCSVGTTPTSSAWKPSFAKDRCPCRDSSNLNSFLGCLMVMPISVRTLTKVSSSSRPRPADSSSCQASMMDPWRSTSCSRKEFKRLAAGSSRSM
mmetsp:Transcript_88756/g.123187  ORF Transcript_88756/g.123187 Transcript_88756/m.123187 type:complete len:239 (-) Transcript_88756:551-1267(-)